MPRGRPPELKSARQTRAGLRLHDDERLALRAAADRAGLPLGEWLRVVGLTAAGRSDLLEQLSRVRLSREEELDVFRRRRTEEIADGLRTPTWNPYPAHLAEDPSQVSKNIAFEAALVLHVWPSQFRWDPQAVWPPAREDLSRPGADIRRSLSRRDIEARRQAVGDALLEKPSFSRLIFAFHSEDGFLLNTVLATDAALSEHKVRPYAYAFLRRNGTIEAAFSLDRDMDKEQLDLGLLGRLPQRVSAYVTLLDQLGGEAPAYVAISLHGVRGRTVHGPDESGRYRGGSPLAKDVVNLPVVQVSDPTEDVAEALRRPLDALWHTCGLRECQVVDTG